MTAKRRRIRRRNYYLNDCYLAPAKKLLNDHIKKKMMRQKIIIHEDKLI